MTLEKEEHTPLNDITRTPFGQSPTTCFVIEIRTLITWLRNDLGIGSHINALF